MDKKSGKKVTFYFGKDSEVSKSLDSSKISSEKEAEASKYRERVIQQELLIKKLHSEINTLNIRLSEEKDLRIKSDKSKGLETIIKELREKNKSIESELNILETKYKNLLEISKARLEVIKNLRVKEGLIHNDPPRKIVKKKKVKSPVDIKPKKYDFNPDNGLQSDRVALFTAINADYIENAVTCFKSYDIQNPGKFDFYIITADSPSNDQQDLCDRNKVKILYQDLNSDFKIDSGWPYPSECFWIFKGPELFYNMGYKISMSVDADTYCSSPLEFKDFDQITLIGGSIRLDMIEMKKNKVPATKVKAYSFITRIEQNKNIFEKNFGYFDKEALSMNSGVLVYNNQNCNTIGFYQQMVDLFKKSKALGFPRKGDDSLLSMFISLNDNDLFTYFGPEWNYYYLFPDQNSNNILKKIKIVHMARVKPWRYDMLGNVTNKNIKAVIKIWKELENMCNTQKENDMKVWFYRPSNGYNFGDEITPWLFKKMFDVNIEKPCNPKDENVLLGVGSIMRLANKNTEVWGSGIRNIDQGDFKGAKKFHAVRGPFTQKRLHELGMKCPDVFGDPGLLLPIYYFPKVEPKYELGIVPHLVDQEIIAEKFGKFDNVKIIDLNDKDIENVVDQFLECKNIVSTSLHGLITAVAYGIPTKWLRASDSINGDDIKFYDFWASLDRRVFDQFDRNRMTVDIEAYQPINIDDVELPEDLINKTNLIPTDKIDLNLLVKTCPYQPVRTLFSTIMMSYLGDYPGARSNPVEKFHRAVRSWLNQTYPNKELVIVSDGCEITNREARKWTHLPQVKLVELKKSAKKWPGANRQVGRDHATGDWITYLDTDDMYEPTFLERIQKEIEKNPSEKALLNLAASQRISIQDWNKGEDFQTQVILKPVIFTKGSTPPNFELDGKRYYWAARTGSSSAFSTSTIIHHKSLEAKWSDEETRGEDILFSNQFKDQAKRINVPGYLTCHITGRLDI